jgi:hypothetical protein
MLRLLTHTSLLFSCTLYSHPQLHLPPPPPLGIYTTASQIAEKGSSVELSARSNSYKYPRYCETGWPYTCPIHASTKSSPDAVLDPDQILPSVTHLAGAFQFTFGALAVLLAQLDLLTVALRPSRMPAWAVIKAPTQTVRRY